MTPCAWHPLREATSTCPRCGSFVCQECRPQLSALSVCASCTRYAPARSGAERLPGIFIAVLAGLQLLWMGGAAAVVAVQLATGTDVLDTKEPPNAGAMVLLLMMTALNLGLMVAAIQFARLRGRGWGYAASIAVMVPCLGPCCVLGIPLGIWGILTAQKLPPEGAGPGAPTF